MPVRFQHDKVKERHKGKRLGVVQEDGVAGEDSEEEGSAEAKSESLDSEIDSEDNEDEEAASRRLNVRTGESTDKYLME